MFSKVGLPSSKLLYLEPSLTTRTILTLLGRSTRSAQTFCPLTSINLYAHASWINSMEDSGLGFIAITNISFILILPDEGTRIELRLHHGGSGIVDI